MPVVINGTTGISTPDGSAGTPPYRGASGATNGLYFPSATSMALAANGTHTADVYGTQAVTLDTSEHFTPYADLTFGQVCGWLDEAMGVEQVAAMDAGLDQQIANQINPPVVSPPLPWAPAPIIAPPLPDMSQPPMPVV